MVRVEFIVTGCVLVLAGVALCIAGYQRAQPTVLDTVVGIVEELSREKAPDGVYSDKTTGYVMCGVGGALFLVGLLLILNSRSSVRSQQSNGGERS
jgi:hypothetical protein